MTIRVGVDAGIKYVIKPVLTPPPSTVVSYILTETSDFLVTETGDRIITETV